MIISLHSLGLTFLASAIVFSYAYCLDIFQALQVPFRQPPYEFSTLQFNLMYFFTYLPIFLFNIPIGTIIDRSSVTKSLFFLLLMSLLSHLICSIMIQTQMNGYLIIMFLMRSFFGVAGEGIYTVQGIIITKYCKDNYQIILSLSLGLPLIFDSLNSLVTTRVYSETNSMIAAWYIGVGVCVLSLVAGFFLYKFYVCEKVLKQQSLLGEVSQIGQNVDTQQKKGQQQSEFNIKQLRSLPFAFWVLIIAGFFSEASLGSFMDNLNELFVQRFNIPYADAGTLLIIPYSCLSIFSIIFSSLMSKFPKIKRTTYLISTLLYLIGHISLYFLPDTTDPEVLHYLVPAFFCLTISFGFSTYYSTIMVAIPYVVPQNCVGTAFGVCGCACGLSYCITPLLNAAIIDSDSDLKISYLSLSLAYIIIAFITFSFSLYIKLGPFDKIDTKLEDKQEIGRNNTENSLSLIEDQTKD